MTTVTERQGSAVPLTILFIAAILTPWVTLQSTFAVLYIALDEAPRLTSIRVLAPAIDIATMALAVLIACVFALILTRSSREHGVRWVPIGVATALVLGGSFVNALVISVRRQVLDDYAPPLTASTAYQASDATLFLGTTLVIVLLLLAPVCARAVQRGVRWVIAAYIFLCAIFALYGIVPLVAAWAKYG